MWYDNLNSDTKEEYEQVVEALLKWYRPHRSTRWLRLKQFQERQQLPHKMLDEFFQAMMQTCRKLNKGDLEIMETPVAGLLPPIARAVMMRNPSTLEEALDIAQTASVMQDRSPSNKVEVALTPTTEQLDKLQGSSGPR